jgi:GT2 family glycosyltransferase
LKTAVVILNWNGRNLLEQFLPAVTRFSKDIAEVIVADNASTDDSIAWLKKHFPSVHLVQNSTNEGFAKGYNSALKKINAEYFLLLNSDVRVTENWLLPLINYLDNNHEVAVCQPKIRWELQTEKFEYAGAAGGYIDALGYPFCRGRIFGELENDTFQFEEIAPVFWCSGACMLIRSEIFFKAGGFDELFFAHMEEIDLCWRIRNLNYEIVCIPQSVVYHVGGATLPKNNPGKTYLNFRNNLSMLYKNLPAGKVFPVIIMRLILDGIAGIKFLLESGFGDFKAVFRAHISFYGWIVQGKLKRRKDEVKREHKSIYKGFIVWDYYITKKKTFRQLNFHPVKAAK